MEEQSTVTKSLFIFQGILATIITILMFYPMFGGTLMILNGTFIYFSYFLAVFLIIILAVIDFTQLYILRKRENIEVKKHNYLSFSFISLVVMIGLLEGHYIFSPLLAIIYIFLMLLQIFDFAVYNDVKNISEHFKINIFDILQRVLFYITAVLLLLGNQPFEVMHIPVATTTLFVLIIISVANFMLKMRKI